MANHKTDDRVVDAFVSHLRNFEFPNLTVEEHPDKTNRATADIDAIAGHFAIEHTSVDVLDEQRLRSDHWHKAVGGLEEELKGCVPTHLAIATGYQAVTTGQNWANIRSALKNWLLEYSERLPTGMNEFEINGVPFPLTIWKREDRPPGVFFSRLVADEDQTLAHTVGPLVGRKAKKLAPYKARGQTTVLLVESDDIAMMNHVVMYKALREACPDGWPVGVDHIWYADTSMWPASEFYEIESVKHLGGN